MNSYIAPTARNLARGAGEVSMDAVNHSTAHPSEPSTAVEPRLLKKFN